LQIHWFSIINSCVTVLLLTGFLATILMRVLKADFVKYTKDEGAYYWWLTAPVKHAGQPWLLVAAPKCTAPRMWVHNMNSTVHGPIVAGKSGWLLHFQ
jgi:hypothetical protein